MRLTHLGHACLLVETGGERLLFDRGAFSAGYAELTDLTAIVVTHQHADHLDVDALPGLLKNNDGARLLTDPQTADQLQDEQISVETFAAGDRTDIGAVQLEGVGGRHAVIHADIPRIGNTGVVVRADGEPSWFHPGDMIDTAPEGIDVLGLPISAPWCALGQSADFLRAIAPRIAVPIHDALLSDLGRGAFLGILGGLVPDGTTVTDLRGAGPTTI